MREEPYKSITQWDYSTTGDKYFCIHMTETTSIDLLLKLTIETLYNIQDKIFFAKTNQVLPVRTGSLVDFANTTMKCIVRKLFHKREGKNDFSTKYILSIVGILQGQIFWVWPGSLCAEGP